ncbi:cleavage stimulating factor 64-like isoform X2 [Musa acuminata AAA Group]|uniref:cleavage stimulating factor 64-like isoform X2 n=1 Tax=Musa acuminata AAA Group TaxID=214697 RepID=UPI0031E230A6
MAASGGSQHRCVFVGNIPYDATEEQLIQICEEVGPVVSFRLVFDRETGKPKGYGFCEYKDEETALSARRNLQGYEINGRQLRVDFAENDKNADRNREQGRGGPGLASSADVQKQFSGAPILGDSTLHQPLGLPLAATAASVMAGVLGGAQTSNAQNVLQSQPGALTAKNKALAHQLLQASPQLSKALFQAQIMLRMVTPQMMQMAGSGQSSISTSQFSSHLGQASSQTLGGKLSKPPETLVPITSQSPVILKQASLPIQQVHVQPQYQLPPLPQGQVLQGTLPSSWPQSIDGVPLQPSPLSSSICPISQSQTPLSQQPVPTVASLTHHPQLAHPNTALQQANLSRPSISQTGLSNVQPPSVGLETLPRQISTSSADSVRTSRINTQSLSGGPADRTSMAAHILEPISYPPAKLRRLEDGSGATQTLITNPAVNNAALRTLGSGTVAGSQTIVTDSVGHSEKQMPQIPPEVESALLQQVLSLTPEQLSSLPLEQQQQVLQLQQMLSASK